MAKDPQIDEQKAEDINELADSQKPTDQAGNQASEADQLKEQLKRLAADFDNYRRRSDEEKKQVVQMAEARTLLALTPVLDNFRRATEHLPAELKDNQWVTGVLYVEKQLEQIFEQFGIQKIKTVGEMFDPKQHEAISHEFAKGVPANQVLAEVEGGFTLNGLVLKPAKVKVSSGEPKLPV